MFVDEAVIKPWSAAVEVTSGCNLRCPYCYINALPWDRDYFRYMSPEEMHHVAVELVTLNPKMRVRFSQRGEPLLNPDIVECIARFRAGAPRFQMQIISNGTVLLDDDGYLIEELFDAGLNILVLDCYEPYGKELVLLVKEWDFDAKYHNYGDGFSPWHNHGPTGRHIVFMPPILTYGDKRTRVLNNQAGNVPGYGLGVLTEPLTKMCPHPWREVVIHGDGNMPICCKDGGTEYMIGNIFEEPLIDIWESPSAQSARRMLRYGQRWFSPCCRCDGPVPGRNTAIPHCDMAAEEDYAVVLETMCISPAENGKDAEWWGP